jgi:hypothetical protein
MVIYLPVHCDDYSPEDVHQSRGDWGGWAGWWEDRDDLDDMGAAIRNLAMSCIAKSPFPGMDCKVIVSNEDDDPFMYPSWEPTERVQVDWAVDGRLHLQVGFYDTTLADSHPDPTSGIYVAMMAYDEMYAQSGSVDPSDHGPIVVGAQDDTLFPTVVDDIYRERLGVWCHGLMNLRNEVMVKTRARLYGDDPDAEWTRFCDAGMVHFLDYLKIWQQPNL